MSLNEDDIVEASLLEPMGDELRTPPTLEEEAALLGEEPELPEAPEAAAFLQECLETTELINALSTPVPSSPTLKPCHHPSEKTKKKSQWGIEPESGQPLTQISPVTGSGPMSRRAEKYPTGGRNSSPFTAWVPSPSTTSTSKT